MNKELYDKINETLDKSLANSTDETQLQVKILKNNINALFDEMENPNKASMSSDVSNQDTESLEILDDPSESAESLQSTEILEESETEKNETLSVNNMKSVLIVDDSSVIRNYLEGIITGDYNINMAVDGNDAVDKIIKNKDIDIILLDLVMPNEDGFYVLDYIKKNNINIPIIIISGDLSKESIEKAFEYGVVDMIEKPFDIDIVKDKIAKYIKKDK